MTLIGSGTITRKLVGSATLGTLAPTTTGGIEIDLLNGGDSTTAFTGSEVATVQLVVRKDTSFNWGTNNPTLAEGEIAYSTDDKWFCIGDGVTEFNDLDDSHFYVNWLDILNFVNSQTSGITTSIGNIQSDISTIQSNIQSSNTILSQLQYALNDVVADISSLQSDISSEASTRSTAVTSLQGQIDTLSGGVMKRLTIQFNASDVPSIEGAPFTIITPTSGKTLLFIAACASVSCATPSSKSLDFQFNNGVTYPNPINTISVSDDINGTTSGIVATGLPYMAIDQSLDLLLNNGGVQSGDAQFTLTIFYMEV